MAISLLQTFRKTTGYDPEYGNFQVYVGKRQVTRFLDNPSLWDLKMVRPQSPETRTTAAAMFVGLLSSEKFTISFSESGGGNWKSAEISFTSELRRLKPRQLSVWLWVYSDFFTERPRYLHVWSKSLYFQRLCGYQNTVLWVITRLSFTKVTNLKCFRGKLIFVHSGFSYCWNSLLSSGIGHVASLRRANWDGSFAVACHKWS